MWKQIRWHEDKKTDERYLMIAVKGKTGYRELVARHGTDKVLGRIQSRFPDLAAMSFDELIANRLDVFVFRLRSGARTNQFSRAFAALLIDLELLRGSEGSQRTLYSLRHTYATLRLAMDKVPIHSLAKQMGTSVGMLEKHYSHLEPVMQAEVFAGERRE
jgi:integrase